MSQPRWQRFVAVGDSFTEGLEDGLPDGTYRGWADRFAERLALRDENFVYANLAVRGRRLDDIINVQLPHAVELKPDLISIAGGINDAMRPRWNLEAGAAMLEKGTREAKESGADVLLFAFGDLSRRSRAIGSVNGRIKDLRDVTLKIADQYECFVLDFWHMTEFDDPQLWDRDRLHLSPIGHALVADRVCEAVGMTDYEPIALPTPAASPSTVERLAADAHWTATYLAPWILRRVRGQSSGDEAAAKRPNLGPVLPAE